MPIKVGSLKGEKKIFPDGIGCCVWYPFDEEDGDTGICFDFPSEDIDDFITLLQKLKDMEPELSESIKLTVICPECGAEDKDIYYAPTSDFKIHKCLGCGYATDLEKYTGISYEDASNLDVIEQICLNRKEKGNMAKFRKKPVVIEAEQFFPADWESHEPHQYPSGVYRLSDGYFIQTLEGTMTVSPGDWIITGIRGEKYPVKPDIFEATYEPVQEGE